jgi:hypothetical protein
MSLITAKPTTVNMENTRLITLRILILSRFGLVRQGERFLGGKRIGAHKNLEWNDGRIISQMKMGLPPHPDSLPQGERGLNENGTEGRGCLRMFEGIDSTQISGYIATKMQIGRKGVLSRVREPHTRRFF